MDINFSKTLNELAPLQISDLIEIDLADVKAVAAGSNGEFLKDRGTLSASEFFAKYFPDFTALTTYEQVESRRKLERITTIKKKSKSTILDQYGSYIVTLWESGNEFCSSYRKTTSMLTQWNILSKNEIEYKVDGRRFSVVFHTNSRKDALDKKRQLIDDMTNRGFIYKGEMPV